MLRDAFGTLCIFIWLMAASSACAQHIKFVAYIRGTSALTPADMRIEFDGKEYPATTIQRVGTTEGIPLECALLIDDSVRHTLLPFQAELEEFVTHLVGPRLAVGVGYMRDGKIRFPMGFSTEPEKVLQAIRDPMTSAGFYGDAIGAVYDLTKRWPVHKAARVILMLSSGGEVAGGGVLSRDTLRDKAVELAVAEAQRASIPIYSVDCGKDASGLKYLSAFADGTAGEVLDGIGEWQSLTPFFTTFRTEMANSYLVTAEVSQSSELHKLKVSPRTSGIKIRVQKQAESK